MHQLHLLLCRHSDTCPTPTPAHLHPRRTAAAAAAQAPRPGPTPRGSVAGREQGQQGFGRLDPGPLQNTGRQEPPPGACQQVELSNDMLKAGHIEATNQQAGRAAPHLLRRLLSLLQRRVPPDGPAKPPVPARAANAAGLWGRGGSVGRVGTALRHLKLAGSAAWRASRTSLRQLVQDNSAHCNARQRSASCSYLHIRRDALLRRALPHGHAAVRGGAKVVVAWQWWG